NMLYKLKKMNLIYWSPRKSLRLTQKGKEIAEKTTSKYNNLKLFFKNVLKLKDLELIDQICCGIEHHITKEISMALENLMFNNSVLLKD
ncbi:MAG: metal-dependent transcriptional regulator, partial [Promethearchaeota archaeon]